MSLAFCTSRAPSTGGHGSFVHRTSFCGSAFPLTGSIFASGQVTTPALVDIVTAESYYSPHVGTSACHGSLLPVAAAAAAVLVVVAATAAAVVVVVVAAALGYFANQLLMRPLSWLLSLLR